MRCLVVYCHPVAESFVGQLYRTALATLEGRGHTVRGLDLYALQFDPVLTREQRLDYHHPERNQAGIEAQIAHLRWAEALVFVYPTWWYGLPAMLKGWLDRVFVPGVTFTMPEANRPVGPLLTHIRVLGGIATYGSPWWWARWIGDPGRRTILRGIGALCAPRRRTFWLAHYKMDSSTPASRHAFLARVERRLRAI
jgi:putative NADPH-quinone reductase